MGVSSLLLIGGYVFVVCRNDFKVGAKKLGGEPITVMWIGKWKLSKAFRRREDGRSGGTIRRNFQRGQRDICSLRN
jgi:hypothetical protein